MLVVLFAPHEVTFIRVGLSRHRDVASEHAEYHRIHVVLRHVSLTLLGSHAVGLCGLQGPFSTGWLTQIAASRKHSGLLSPFDCS